MGRPYRFYENRILKRYFDTERLLDSQGRGSCDGKTKDFAIELFQTKIPKYLQEAIRDADINRYDDFSGLELIPAVVWFNGDTEPLVLMKMSDFSDWFGLERNLSNAEML